MGQTYFCLWAIFCLLLINSDLGISAATRKARLQRNHIACAMLVWIRLKNLAYQTGQTIYKIKHNLLSNYLIQQLKRSDVYMCLVSLHNLLKNFSK